MADPADILRRAADELEHRSWTAQDWVTGRWETDTSEIYAGPARERIAEATRIATDAETTAYSSYIALIDPTVGKALVAWLRREAGAPVSSSEYRRAALAVARALLREADDGN